MLKISNSVTNEERHYLQNLINSGAGFVRDSDGKLPANATHELVVDKGFIVAAKKIMRQTTKVKK